MNRLPTLILVAGLLAGAPLLIHAAGEKTTAAPSHPIVGTWTWALFGGACTETLQYRANKTVLGTSGQEVFENRYDITAAPDAQGFYKLVETVVRQNDKKDCSGAMLDGPGEKTTRFIQFSPKQDQLLVCEAATLKSCFGPLKRVP
ncbi:hypothetical protein [Polaromonas sp. SM01]|uniref:hypothetical protein n=1 Tax=Polaromonas sp. SM01 TaxID=3085630 RepID=UPI002982B036|nr:hypothetical protein [Polaromonas sp. SM01]MDW5442664.1 hypothetical protein [Polaromonas sp. SM01]